MSIRAELASIPTPLKRTGNALGVAWVSMILTDLDYLTCISSFLWDYRDAARLSLSCPHTWRVAIHGKLVLFCHPLFRLAMRMCLDPSLSITRDVLTQYVSQPGADAHGFSWIKHVSPSLYLLAKDFSSKGFSHIWYIGTQIGNRICTGYVVAYFSKSGCRLIVEYDDAAPPPAKYRSVKRIAPDGVVTVYDGWIETARMVSKSYPRGLVAYEGNKGSERIVSIRKGGTVTFYDGAKGVERMVRHVRPDGRTAYYEGTRNNERIVRAAWRDTVCVYEGEKGAERLVQKTFPDGQIQFMEGNAPMERIVRVLFPSGVTQFYDGEAASERLVRRVSEKGLLSIFRGERGWEECIRTI